jgi:hypothetical protein
VKLNFLAVNPSPREVGDVEEKLSEIKADLTAAIGADETRAVAEQATLDSVSELFSYFNQQKDKYYRLHPSWKWRGKRPALLAAFSARYEKIGIEFLRVNGVLTDPNMEADGLDGVAIRPVNEGGFLNRIAAKIKNRFGINLVFSPRALVLGGADGMYDPVTRNLSVSKALLESMLWDSVTSHEIVHAYLDSISALGFATPVDYVLEADEGKDLSELETGYEDTLDGSEPIAISQEIADASNRIRILQRQGAGPFRILEEVTTVWKYADQAEKISRVMIRYLTEALDRFEHSPRGIRYGAKDATWPDPFSEFVAVKMEKGTLFIRVVDPEGVATLRGPRAGRAATLKPGLIARLRADIAFYKEMNRLLVLVRDEGHAAGLKPASHDLGPLTRLAPAPKNFAFSSLPKWRGVK